MVKIDKDSTKSVAPESKTLYVFRADSGEPVSIEADSYTEALKKFEQRSKKIKSDNKKEK